MLEEKNTIYKDLYFKINSEFNYLEVLIDEVNFANSQSYITSASIILEYALTILPQYIILNKLHSDFEIEPKLYTFTSKNIFDPLKSNGIRKIICLVKEEEYRRRYKDIERMEPFIKGLTTKDEAIIWMSNK